MARLITSDLAFSYGNSRPVFKDLTISLGLLDGIGRVVTLLGASASGKSTLLRLLAGLLRPSRGHITLEPSGSWIGYVPQESILFEHLSVGDNLNFFRNIAAQRSRFDEAALQRAKQVLRIDDLNPLRTVVSLSGGQKQRIALARALSVRPAVLLLDEPCTGLDTPLKAEFLYQLRELTDDQGLLVVYTTHHRDEVHLIADEIVYLHLVNDQTARTVHTPRSVTELLSAPPTPECARMLYGPDMSFVECTVRECEIYISQLERPVARAHDLADGKHLLGIPVASVRAGCAGPLHLTCTYRSDRYWFARIAGTPTPIVALRENASTPDRLMITGNILVFTGGSVGRWVEVITPSGS